MTAALPQELLARVGRIVHELQERFVERDEVVEGIVAAMIAGEHVLLLGPVGTGKSMLAREACQRVRGAAHFSWLLTKFSTPEELFGPVSLTGLENDEFRRVTTGKLPEASIAFLDEVFKASSAILNTLLSLMNERVFHNGGEAARVPLVTLVGASNELPDDGELMALYDRFLVRFSVEYIKEEFRFLKMLTLDADAPDGEYLTLDELSMLRRALREVVVGDRVLGDLVELRRRLDKKGIVASDRRYRQSLDLLRAYALLRGRDVVGDAEVEELRHVLWSEPEEEEEVARCLHEILRGHIRHARELLAQADEVREYARREWQDAELAMRASIEAHTKLNRLVESAEDLLRKAVEASRSTHEIELVVEQLRQIQREILEDTLHG